MMQQTHRVKIWLIDWLIGKGETEVVKDNGLLNDMIFAADEDFIGQLDDAVYYERHEI